MGREGVGAPPAGGRMEFSLAELSDTDGQSAASRAAGSIRGARAGRGGPRRLPGTPAPRPPTPGHRPDKRPTALSEPGSAMSPGPQHRKEDQGTVASL